MNQANGRLHVWAIEAGERTARVLALLSVITSLDPSLNAEVVARMREYGNEFATKQKAKLVAERVRVEAKKQSSVILETDRGKSKRTQTQREVSLTLLLLVFIRFSPSSFHFRCHPFVRSLTFAMCWLDRRE